jgi:L-malate glycosyltransferase
MHQAAQKPKASLNEDMPIPMKVLFVGSAASVHCYRWISGLTRRGLKIHLVTAEQPAFEFPCDLSIISLPKGPAKKISSIRTGVSQIRTDFAKKKMDILHCHYAGRYGMWGALSKVHPFLLSMWGSDILVNPNKSIVHRAALGWMLKTADHLQSTSNNMASAASELYGLKNIAIVPFGIDTERFAPLPKHSRNNYRIVSIKSLEQVYGFEVLIHALAEIHWQGDLRTIECSIYGEGSQRKRLEELVYEMGLSNIVTIKGRIRHEWIPEVLSNADLAVYPSYSESFGVSALEAMACGCPVIMSDAPGHLEISKNLPTATIVPRNSVSALVKAIRASIINNDEMQMKATLAVNHVRTNYSWEDSLDIQIRNYERISAKRNC